MQKEKFYNKDWFMWLMFATLSPVGIFLMWKNKKYRLCPRIITSICYLFYFLAICGTVGNKNSQLSFISEFIRMFIFFALIPYAIVHWSKIYKTFLILVEKFPKENKFNNNRERSGKTNIIKGLMNRMSIKYVGGYPTSSKGFTAIIKTTESELIFVKQLTGMEQFRINKKDVLNIDCKHDDLRKFNKDFMVLKVNYKDDLIELILQCGAEPSKEYDKLYSLVYGNTTSSYKSGFSVKQPVNPRSIVLFLVGIILVIVGFNVINGPSKSTQTTNSTKQASSQAQEKDTTNDTQKNAKAEQSKDDGSIKEGMYKIGSDLSAGEYIIIANDDTGAGYMQITKDSTGTINSIISNENISGRTYVTVNDGEYLTIKDAKAYPLDKAPKIDTSSGVLSDGMYKVGVDIQPGEYKVNSPGDGYVEVTTNSRHTVNGIVSNDNFSGDKYVSVQNGQYLKISHATLTLK